MSGPDKITTAVCWRWITPTLPLSRTDRRFCSARTEAGKPTGSIKLANGLLQPTSGSILVIDVTPPSPKTHAIVSYLPERIALTDWMNVRQLMDFYGDFYADFQREAAEQMLCSFSFRLARQSVRCPRAHAKKFS